MNANYRVQITLNNQRSGQQKNTRQILQWLQNATPSITKKQKLITDDLFLAPLGRAVSLCLN